MYILDNIYVADYTNHRIRKVTVSTSIITTIAGTGTSSYSGDNGAATSAALKNPIAVALDLSGSANIITLTQLLFSLADTLGNVYIADSSNNRIRKITVSTGIITTIAGSSTSSSYSGDGGAATSAALNSPSGVAVDSSGRRFCL